MSRDNKSDTGQSVTRRDVLRTTGGAIAAGGLVGTAAANGGNGQAEFNVGYTNERGRGAAQDAADSVKREFNFDAMTIRASEKAAEGLKNNPNIRYVEENAEMEALAQTTPWGIDRVDADVAHENGETGNGADIAILDTGLDSDHYDLADRIQGGKCFTDECCGEATGGIFGCDDNDNECLEPWDDDNDHGTHCAGSADAIDNTEGVVGVSTEANLWAGKVLTGCGSGSYDGIAAGIEWAADQGHDVASMSLGGDASDVVKDACVYAYDKGVLLVAAAGNDGECTDCVGYPAAYEEVIAVSATSEDDSLASFSSTGPEVELAAPGEDVLSTVPTESSSDGLDTFSGTSMACPHVSGAGAQLMANGYTNTEARQQLGDTAEDIGLGDNEQGNGLLDVAAALGLDGGDGDTNTAPSCTTVNPSDGETVSGTVTVQVDASDEEDDDTTLDVEVSIDGGTYQSASYNSDSGYYEYGWDTTAEDDGDHTVDARATDSDGATTDASQITVTVDNSTDTGNSAPVIDSWSVSTRSTGPWFRVTSTWDVSDADGNLDSVTTELLNGGSVVASQTSNVSGSSASGEHEVRTRDSVDEVRLVVTDTEGASDSDTEQV